MSVNPEAAVVTAYFADRADAEHAISELRAAGFNSDDIRCPGDEGARLSYRSLTSDQYSPSSATIAAAEGGGSFMEKLKHVFSPEPADSDVNDHTAISRAHAQGGYDGRQDPGMAASYALRDRQTKPERVVSVYARDRVWEAQQILTRYRGEIQPGSSSVSSERFAS